MKPFSVEELLSTARARTGLSDFGPPDFMQGLTALVSSLNAQALINESRWYPLEERFLQLLTNRLWFAKDMAEHPGIATEKIASPVVIASLPRTGSTKLHRLLGASGDFQTMQFWKTHMFARIPGTTDGGVAQRIQTTREFEKWMYEISPEILTGHPMFTDEPEEDQWLGESTFRQPFIAGMYDVPGYGEWLMRADPQPVYDYFLSQLKYLQWQFRPATDAPWLLKSPNHLGNEKDLCKIFGRPRFIVTHRDPAECVPSITSTALSLRRLYQPDADVVSLGAVLTGLVAYMATEHLKWRNENPDALILDLSFHEISEDGMSAARKVYDFLDMPLTARAEQAMRDWEHENRRNKYGKNVYSLEMMETSEVGIRQAFAPYIERYAKYFQRSG